MKVYISVMHSRSPEGDREDIQVFDTKEKALDYNREGFEKTRQWWDAKGLVLYHRTQLSHGNEYWAICDSQDEENGYYLLIERAGVPKYIDEIKLIEREIL